MCPTQRAAAVAPTGQLLTSDTHLPPMHNKQKLFLRFVSWVELIINGRSKSDTLQSPYHNYCFFWASEPPWTILSTAAGTWGPVCKHSPFEVSINEQTLRDLSEPVDEFPMTANICFAALAERCRWVYLKYIHCVSLTVQPLSLCCSGNSLE